MVEIITLWLHFDLKLKSTFRIFFGLIWLQHELNAIHGDGNGNPLEREGVKGRRIL